MKPNQIQRTNQKQTADWAKAGVSPTTQAASAQTSEPPSPSVDAVRSSVTAVEQRGEVGPENREPQRPSRAGDPISGSPEQPGLETRRSEP